MLGAIEYQRNEAVLHTDASLMPRSRRAWAAWNYHLPRGSRDGNDQVTLTYERAGRVRTATATLRNVDGTTDVVRPKAPAEEIENELGIEFLE